jgi:hypothetical protein
MDVIIINPEIAFDARISPVDFVYSKSLQISAKYTRRVFGNFG